jgi:hypothetical protein
VVALRVVIAFLAFGASLAGADVAASLSGSMLKIEGDASPDTIVIQAVPGGGVVVSGREGTLVNGSALDVPVVGATRLRARLRGGADRLTLVDVTFDDGIGIRLGDGNDAVVLERAHAGATRIRTGDGWDLVGVYGPSRLRHLSVLTARSPDSVVVDGISIRGNLYVDAGSEDDDVSVVFTEIGNDARIFLGSDEDLLFMADVAVYDDTDLDGEDGDDWLGLAGYIWFDDELDIDGFDGDWYY